MAEDDKTKKKSGSEQQSSEMTRAQGDVATMGRYGTMTSPFALMRRMFDEMDRLFEDFGGSLFREPLFGDPFFRGGLSTIEPKIDVSERDDKLVVRADVPGIRREDLQVHVDDNAILIAGERKHSKEEEREGYLHSERSYGRFERRIPLPRGADPSSADATFENGVLEITVGLPKKSSRRIEVRGGGERQLPQQQQQQQQQQVQQQEQQGRGVAAEPPNGPAPARH